MSSKPKKLELVPKSKVIGVPEPFNGNMKGIQGEFDKLQSRIQELQLRFTIESQNAALETGLVRTELQQRQLITDPTGNWIWERIENEHSTVNPTV